MSKLVFIVEDDMVQQKMLAKHFENMVGNFSVRAFSDPDDMMAHLNEKPFAVVLDHYFGNASVKTGLDYLQTIRKKYSRIPVIYHTSSEDKGLKDKVMRLGAVDYIYKDLASFVRLRTVLDELERNRIESEKGGFLKKLFRNSFNKF
ncbi:MAG: response regulator [Cyclobacteriaceae bacterium]